MNVKSGSARDKWIVVSEKGLEMEVQADSISVDQAKLIGLLLDIMDDMLAKYELNITLTGTGIPQPIKLKASWSRK